MRAFLWVYVAMAVLGVLGKAIWLARGEFPERKAWETVVDLIFGMLMAGWAVFLLSSAR